MPSFTHGFDNFAKRRFWPSVSITGNEARFVSLYLVNHRSLTFYILGAEDEAEATLTGKGDS